MSDVALRFGATDDGLNAKFRTTNSQLDALKANVGKASASISASFGAITAAAAAIGFSRLIGEATQFADELEKASARTGIAVEGLQSLSFIGSQVGVDLNTMTGAVNRMQNQLTKVGEGSAEATAALARLHIPISDFFGLKPDEQFSRVAVAIAEMRSPSEQTAAAIGLFGKSGAELLPILKSTGEELIKMEAQFDAIGGPVSASAIAKVDEIGDAAARTHISVKNLVTELLAIGGPAVIAALDTASHFFAGLRIAAGGGSNEIIKIDKSIEDLQGRINRLKGEGGLNSLAVPDLVRLNAELQLLILRQRELLGLNGSPLVEVGVDISKIALPKNVQDQLAKIPGDLGELSPQERRQQTTAGDSPVLIKALEEKDLLLKINQDKLDEMLRQETAHASARGLIATDTARFLAQVRETFGLQEIKFEEIKNQSIIEIAGGLFGSLARENSKLAKIQQAIALAQAIWSTSAGITKALELPFPASIIAAGKVALVGAIQIAKIKATNYNAGSVSSASAPSVSGGGGGAVASQPVSQPPAPAKERGVAQIIINGPITGEASMRWLVDRLRESIGDFDLVLTRSS